MKNFKKFLALTLLSVAGLSQSPSALAGKNFNNLGHKPVNIHGNIFEDSYVIHPEDIIEENGTSALSSLLDYSIITKENFLLNIALPDQPTILPGIVNQNEQSNTLENHYSDVTNLLYNFLVEENCEITEIIDQNSQYCVRVSFI